jgi:hypothetical protein
MPAGFYGVMNSPWDGPNPIERAFNNPLFQGGQGFENMRSGYWGAQNPWWQQVSHSLGPPGREGREGQEQGDLRAKMPAGAPFTSSAMGPPMGGGAMGGITASAMGEDWQGGGVARSPGPYAQFGGGGSFGNIAHGPSGGGPYSIGGGSPLTLGAEGFGTQGFGSFGKGLMGNRLPQGPMR